MGHNCTNYSTAAMCSKKRKNKTTNPTAIDLVQREYSAETTSSPLQRKSISSKCVHTHKNNGKKRKKERKKKKPMLTAHARALSMIQHVICLSIRKQIQPRISFFKFCSCLLFALNIFYGFPLFLSSFVSLKTIDPTHSLHNQHPTHNLHNQHPRKSNRLKNSIGPTITVSRPLYYYLHKPVRRSRRHATDASFVPQPARREAQAT